MKRIALFVLSLVLVFACAAPAFAAGKLEIVQENFYSLEPYEDSFYTYVYAEVTNSGDALVEFDNVLWEVFNPEGDTLDSITYASCYPEILEPGQTGYVYARMSMDDIESTEEAANFLLTITGDDPDENTIITLPATVRYELTEYGWRNAHDLIATVTNETDQVLYDFRVVFAIKDAEGKLLFVEDVSPSYVGIMPGTSIEVKCDPSYNDVAEKLLEDGTLTFDQVEVIAYADTDD